VKKIVIILLLLVLCLQINVKGTTTTGSFTPLNNHGPQFSNETPSNNTVSVALSPLLSIQANDTEGDLFNLTFSVYSGGSWVIIGTNNSASNGTYTCTNTSIIQEYSTTYQWKISGIDYRGATNETIYQFTTIEALQADFTYVIDGCNIICTSTSTGPPTSYMWEVSNDGVIFGSTGWINDSSGINQIFTYPDGGNICVRLSVKKGSSVDSIMKCIGSMPGNNKDKYPPEYYHNCKACEDAGYYWYNDSCHNTPKPLPWNVPKPLPEAKKSKDIYQISLGGWKIDFRILVVILIVIGLLWIVFSKRKKKKGDE